MKSRVNLSHQARGFTLLEMMAAIAILAVASSAVYFSNSEALTSQVRLEEQTVAQWILANQAALDKLKVRLDHTGSPILSSSLSGTKHLEFAGIDWELSSHQLPSNTPSITRVQWEAFRIVDGRRIGPIRVFYTVRTGHDAR